MPTALLFSDRILQNATIEPKSKVRTADFEGYRAVVPESPLSEYDVWTISLEPLTLTEARQFRAFLKQVGSWDIVTWQPYGDTTTKKFRIVPDSVRGTFNADLHYFTLSLRQDF